MIESGGDGAERSHASAFPPTPGGGSGIGGDRAGVIETGGVERSYASAFPSGSGGGSGIGGDSGGVIDAGGVDETYTSAIPSAHAPGVGSGDAGADERGAGLPDEPRGGSVDGEDARVRSCLAPLDRLATLPVREHVAVFEQVFSGLESTLATVAGEGRAETPPSGAAGVGGDRPAGGGGEAGSAGGRGLAGGGGSAGGGGLVGSAGGAVGP